MPVFRIGLRTFSKVPDLPHDLALAVFSLLSGTLLEWFS